MFALEIRFLTGRYAASRPDAQGEAEWPPHPARVFSALTAAMYERLQPSPGDRDALEWLAGVGAPEVLASNATRRRLNDVYVPVNDVKALDDIDLHLDRLGRAIADSEGLEGEAATKAARKIEKLRGKVQERSSATSAADGKGAPGNASEVLDEPHVVTTSKGPQRKSGRPRHPRRFPVAIPEHDVVHLRWSDHSPPRNVREALDRLCERVARLGHSSSLVSVRLVEEDVPTARRRVWRPDPNGHEFLRVPLPEQLRLLDQAFEAHQQIEPRILPSDPQQYSEVRPDGTPIDHARSVFSDRAQEWIVYEIVRSPAGGPRTLLDLTLAQQVARALRGTLLASLDPNAPPTLTGHETDGSPTSSPHLAFVSLGDVGHQYASGSILGVGMIPPRGLAVSDRDALLEGVFRAERDTADELEVDSGAGSGRRLRLTLGRHGVLNLRRLITPPDRRTLMASHWCRPARRWVSASAVALGRNPGNLRSREPNVVTKATEAAEKTVADACRHAGLPTPEAVWIHQRSLVRGAGAARRFMPFPDGGDGPRRVCVHTEIVFGEPVIGPVLLGAGRFFGLGLHLPVDIPFSDGLS